MFFEDNEGKPSIPYLDSSSAISDYLYSLRKINKLDFEIIIQGHGKVLRERIQIQRELDNRLYYLEQLKKSKGHILLKDCLLGEVEMYSGTNFHDYNCLIAKCE